jgi:hypothetical protein
MKFTLINTDVIARCADMVARMAVTDPPQVVTIATLKSTRSLAQNALYWKWIDIIRMHVGDTTGQHFDKDSMHEFLAGKFQPTIVVEVCGEVRTVRKSTSKNSVEEMQEYMNLVDRYCADRLHLILPVREMPEP